MREDVCIVLNEREPLKRQMAAALEEQLQLRKLSCNRVEALPGLAEIIQERRPRVLVLDYVLGDIATALDLLPTLSASGSETILWTDEPSVQVAVTAMKLGAVDFVQIGHASSLERVIAAIEHSLSSAQYFEQRPRRARPGASELRVISNSKPFQNCLLQAAGMGKRNERLVVLHGASGSGRDTVARYIHQQRHGAGAYHAIDLASWLGELSVIFGGERSLHTVPYLSYGATVFVDHVEFDNSALLEAVQKRFNANSRKLPDPSVMLIVGSRAKETADAWARLLEAPRVDIPPLAERADDFWPLTQLFLSEIKGSASFNRLQFTAPAVHKLTTLEWPGNVRQLRAAVIEAATIPVAEGRPPDSVFPDLSRSDAQTVQVIIDAKTRWEEQSSAVPFVPAPLEARRALEQAAGDYRIAAAMLGTGIPQMREALSLTAGN